jgi:hypothetical protein
MTGRSFAVSMASVAIVAALAGRCTAPEPRGLPPQVLSVVDTATVNRLGREKVEGLRRELAASRRRQAAEDSAGAARHRADSLEAAAKAAQTSADSAAKWQQAYYQRSGEAADLQLALKDAGAEKNELRQQLRDAESGSGIWKTHALRGDSVIAQLLPLAETAGERCRIARVLKCPSRKQTAIAAVVGTMAVLYSRGSR